MACAIPYDAVEHHGGVSTIVMVAQVHPDDFQAFVACEDRFVTLFNDHGLVLRHRFRDEQTSSEVHVIEVSGPHSLESYFADPRRAVLEKSFATLRIEQRVLTVTDVANIAP